MDPNKDVKAREDFGERKAPGCTAPPNLNVRRLLIRGEVLSLLRLSEDQVQLLINTRQIVSIRIAGEERFDSRDLDQLIESYKSTAARRVP